MTDQERERVVELLRCAADRGLHHRWFWLVADDVEASGSIVAFAQSACEAVNVADRFGQRQEALEAAQLVEERAWP